MLKDTSNLISAKVVAAHCPTVVAETESGQQFEVNVTREQKRDPLFWATITDILREGIWIPVTKRYHQLSADGWLLSQPALAPAVASDGVFDYNY
ncbi:hypothetical protein ACRYI5_10505 [Furfurilactobacillus sp. WILCCON 0119]|uniref:hypothetical protein n=1 Tax=Furfurilactobacillus entadae TaxID=2922307 RepID=UPI0035E57A84